MSDTTTAPAPETSASAEWQKRQAKAAQKAQPQKPSEPAPAPSEPAEDFGGVNFGAVEMGLEGLTSIQTLGKFEPPRGFDMDQYATAWGCVVPGSVEGFPSVDELCQPKLHPEIRATFPGFRKYRDPVTGQPHRFKKGGGELEMVYTLRSHVDAVNTAFAKYSRDRLKLTDLQIAKTNLVLPPEVRMAQQSEEDRLTMEIQMLQNALTPST